MVVGTILVVDDVGCGLAAAIVLELLSLVYLRTCLQQVKSNHRPSYLGKLCTTSWVHHRGAVWCTYVINYWILGNSADIIPLYIRIY